VRAANAALSAFGARADDQLIFVGYSQGGMVAAELAETKPNVSGLITLGSPIAQSNFQPNLPVLSIEHTNDVVPACSGKTNPLTDNWVTASRHLDLEPGQSIGEAHKISNYVATAGLADASSDSGLARVRSQLLTQIEESVLLETKEYAATKESLVP
jgi:pimeloyl-ACP methyl ester carboxylesterase